MTWAHGSKNQKCNGKIYELRGNQDDIWLVAILTWDTNNNGCKKSLDREDAQKALSAALAEADMKDMVAFCTKITISGVYRADVRYQMYAISSNIWNIPCEY